MIRCGISAGSSLTWRGWPKLGFDLLSDLFILRGVPAHIHSDKGPEFVAKAVQEWIGGVGAGKRSTHRVCQKSVRVDVLICINA